MPRHQLTPSCHPDKETKKDHKSASGLILQFQENPEIIEFPKSEPFNRNFQKLRIKKSEISGNFGYTAQDRPVFLEILGNAVPFVNGNFLVGNSN